MTDTTKTPRTTKLGTKTRRQQALARAVTAYNEAAARALESMETPAGMDQLFMKEMERRRDFAIQAVTGEDMASERLFGWGDQPLKEETKRRVIETIRPMIYRGVSDYFDKNAAAIDAKITEMIPKMIDAAFGDLYEVRKLVESQLVETLKGRLQARLSAQIDAAVREFDDALKD